MPRLKKLLSQFNKKERETIESLLESIVSLSCRNLDIKKLKGHQNIFRVRGGDIRIIFMREKKEIFILSIDRRNENTYKL